MRRILPLVLATSVLVPAFHAGDAPAPLPPTAPTSDATPTPAVPGPTAIPAVPAAAAPAPAAEAKPAPAPVPTAEAKPAPVAETSPPIDADLPEGAFVATMKANGNVRYGPNRNAKVALTMKAGGKIVVLGAARGVPEWLLVRLPREASVWMHRKVLTPQDGGKTFIVNEDRAKARDDATLGGNIVCEVEKGEIVEPKGRQVGDWHAVYVPSATAYVHRSVLVDDEKMPKAPVVDRAFIYQLWAAAQQRYDAYQAALQKDLDVAAILDWNYLSQQLGEVVAKHPDSQVQAAAKRMQDGIAKVVRAVADIQDRHGVKPQRDVPGQAPIADPPVPETAQGGTRTATPAGQAPVAQNGGRPPRINTGAIPPSIPDKPKPQYPVVGYVIEQAYPGVGVNHVVVDENQNVLAFLRVKDGSPLQIHEYFWRNVGVKGEKVAVDPAKHKLGKDIPLYVVEDLVLIKQ